MSARHFSSVDKLLFSVDAAVRTLTGNAVVTQRENPAKGQEPVELSETDKALSGRLMRINHAGEVAAQGLYQGQALTAKLPKVKAQMEQAAAEENDHLAWCRSRIEQLGTHTSVLDPMWFAGSVAIGAAAGLVGDKWSLGFVAETEKQVVKHLDSHLQQIAAEDKASRAILEQMREDERQHATVALEAGAAELPTPIKKAMGMASKVMTKSAYWV